MTDQTLAAAVRMAILRAKTEMRNAFKAEVEPLKARLEKAEKDVDDLKKGRTPNA